MERFGSQVVALKNGMEFNSMAILYVGMRPCFSGGAQIPAADDQTVLGLGDMVMLLLMMMMIGNGQHGIGHIMKERSRLCIMCIGMGQRG